MKIIIAGSILALVVSMSAWGQTNDMEPEYPITGMSGVDLGICIQHISRKLPVGPRVTGVTVNNNNKVTVNLGEIAGPLAGHGQYIIYERKQGEWVETSRGSWVS